MKILQLQVVLTGGSNKSYCRKIKVVVLTIVIIIIILTGLGLGAPHFFMLQVVLKEKLILSHLGQVQSPSESPSGPKDEKSHKK